MEQLIGDMRHLESLCIYALDDDRLILVWAQSGLKDGKVYKYVSHLDPAELSDELLRFKILDAKQHVREVVDETRPNPD